MIFKIFHVIQLFIFQIILSHKEHFINQVDDLTIFYRWESREFAQTLFVVQKVLNLVKYMRYIRADVMSVGVQFVAQFTLVIVHEGGVDDGDVCGAASALLIFLGTQAF